MDTQASQEQLAAPIDSIQDRQLESKLCETSSQDFKIKSISNITPNYEAQVASQFQPRRRQKYSRIREYRRRLFEFNQVPDYLQDNRYILGSYRANYSLKDTLKSLFRLHNETGNVWTHLAGFVLFVCLTVYLASSPPTPVALDQSHATSLWIRAQTHLSNARQNVITNLGSIQSELSQIQSSLGNQYQQVKILGGNIQSQVSQYGSNLHSQLEDMQCQIKEYFHKEPSLSVYTKLQQRLTNTYNSFLLDKGTELSPEEIHDLDQQVQVELIQSLNKIRKDSNLSKLNNYSSSEIYLSLRRQLQQLFNWPTNRWPFYVYMAGAMVCMFQSSVSHLAYVISRKWSNFLWKLDYSGIIVLILASFLAPVYYGFLCETFYQWLYMGVTILFGIGVLSLSLSDRCQTTFPQWFRGGMFMAMGIWGVVPLLHQFLANYYDSYVRTALCYFVTTGVVYLAGAVFYITRIPERLKPGKFDIFFHSHQIFHVTIVVAAFLHYVGIYELVQWRDMNGGCIPKTYNLAGNASQFGTHLEYDQISFDRLVDEVMSKIKSELFHK